MKHVLLAFLIMVIAFSTAGGENSVEQLNTQPKDLKDIFPQWNQYVSAGLITDVHRAQKLPGLGKVVFENIIFDFSSTKIFIRLLNPQKQDAIDHGLGIREAELYDNFGINYSGSVNQKGEILCLDFPPIYPDAKSLKLVFRDIYEDKYSNGKKMNQSADMEMSTSKPSRLKIKQLGFFKFTIPARNFSHIVREISLNKKFKLNGYTLTIEKLFITPTDAVIYIPELSEFMFQLHKKKFDILCPLLVDINGEGQPLFRINNGIDYSGKDNKVKNMLSKWMDFYNTTNIIKLNIKNIKVQFLLENGEIVRPAVIKE